MDKTAREAVTLLEELASQGYMGDETTMAKARGVLELDSIKLLSAKVDALTNLVNKAHINSIENTNVACEFCGGNHESVDCQAGNLFFFSSTEQVNYMDNSQGLQNAFFSNAYNHG